jgi:hypothetical protein
MERSKQRKEPPLPVDIKKDDPNEVIKEWGKVYETVFKRNAYH